MVFDIFLKFKEVLAMKKITLVRNNLIRRYEWSTFILFQLINMYDLTFFYSKLIPFNINEKEKFAKKKSWKTALCYIKFRQIYITRLWRDSLAVLNFINILMWESWNRTSRCDVMSDVMWFSVATGGSTMFPKQGMRFAGHRVRFNYVVAGGRLAYP